MLAKDERYYHLKQLLEEGLAIAQQKQTAKMADVRNSGSEEKPQPCNLSDGGDIVSSDSDIEVVLLEMEARDIRRYKDALSRLEEGCYGYCLNCGREIKPKRLKALSFAIRCKDCEEARERATSSSKNRPFVQPDSLFGSQ